MIFLRPKFNYFDLTTDDVSWNKRTLYLASASVNHGRIFPLRGNGISRKFGIDVSTELQFEFYRSR